MGREALAAYAEMTASRGYAVYEAFAGIPAIQDPLDLRGSGGYAEDKEARETTDYAENKEAPVPLVTPEQPARRDRQASREELGTRGRQVLPDTQAPRALPEIPDQLGRRARMELRQIPALRVPQAILVPPVQGDLRVLTG